MIEALTPDKIIRAQKGDTSVISELYRRYHQSVFRYLFYRVGDQQTAEDLTSEVFLRVLRAISSYQPQNVSFEAWLFQIARNLAIDHYRKMSTQNHVSLDDTPPVDQHSVDFRNDKRFDNQVLVQALNQLNETQRDVIVLRFINGLPLSQVARTLHKSEDSIKALQRRGLAALREILYHWEIENV